MDNKNLGLIRELAGQNPHLEQLKRMQHLNEKWEQTGLLEGFDHEYNRTGMAILLENQARQLINEASSTGTSSNSEEWSGVALPLVRRIFGEISSKDFVSVQPMNLPSGLVFWLDFKYGTTKGGITAGNNIHGTTDTQDTDATGGLYGQGRFGYSVNSASLAATSVTGNTTCGYGSASINLLDVEMNATLSASIAAGRLYELFVATSSFTNPDVKGVRAFKPAHSTGAYLRAYYPQYTKVVKLTAAEALGGKSGSTSATGEYVRFVCSGSSDFQITTAGLTIEYHKQPSDITRGDFEDSTPTEPATDIRIPEINVEMRSEAIVAKTRKLKAIWTPEFAQDLNAYHSVDAEAELTSMLSEYISMEIDLEIIDMLIQEARTTAYWSVTIGEQYDGAGGAETDWIADPGAAAYNQQTWFQTLGTKIQKVSNKIHQKTMRGGANFLVCGPDVATILESIPGYAVDTDGDKQNFPMGVQKVGMLNSRFNVYKNPYMTDNVILLGFRGNQFLETGAVYAPYIPLLMTPLVYDPTNFTPRKGVMTRYAKKMTRPEFYGKIIVRNLDQV